MNRTILLLGFLFLSLSASAAGLVKDFWVIGSFKELDNARTEQQRLAYWLPNSIRVASISSNGTKRYRLLMTEAAFADHKDKLAQLGIKPWKSKVSPKSLEMPIVSARLGANLSYVLVLAGFHDEEHAEKHAEKLRKDSAESIRVVNAQVNDDEYYRVVSGPYDAELAAVRDQFVLMGIDDAWWMDMPGKVLVRSVPESMEASKQESIKIKQAPPRRQATNHVPVVESSIDTVPNGMSLRAPNPNESYIEYCIRKANAAERAQYCGDGEFLSQQDKRISAMGEERLFKFCATEATGSERRKYCGNGALSERGTR